MNIKRVAEKIVESESEFRCGSCPFARRCDLCGVSPVEVNGASVRYTCKFDRVVRRGGSYAIGVLVVSGMSLTLDGKVATVNYTLTWFKETWLDRFHRLLSRPTRS